MPYNPQTQATVLIPKETHKLLRIIAKSERRTIQTMLQIMIENYIHDGPRKRDAPRYSILNNTLPKKHKDDTIIMSNTLNPTPLSTSTPSGNDQLSYNIVVEATGQILKKELTKIQADIYLSEYNPNGDLAMVEIRS